MVQLLSRRGIALLGKAAHRVGSNRSAKLVVTCFKDSKHSKHAQTKAEKPVEQTVEAQADQQVEKAKITFQVPHHVEWGQDMCLVGEAESLGNWDVNKCVPMAWHEGDVWTAEAELPQGASIEYKYIVRGAIDEAAPEVVEWQPCWNLALTADKDEITVRDQWEGAVHEVLPGTLPLPVIEASPPPAAAAEDVTPEPAPAPTAAADTSVSATVVAAAAAAEPVVAAVHPVPPAPVAVDTPVDVEDLVPDQVYAGPTGRSALSIDVPEGVVAAEELAAAEAKGGFNAAAVPLTGLSGNGNKPHIAEAADEILAHNEVPNKGPHTPNYLADKTPKSKPARDLSSLAISELKDMCKAKGLPTKGQRRDLLARLLQHKA